MTKPYDYAAALRSDQRLKLISIVMAVIGLADSIYLTWIKLANATASCAGIGDCDAVNSSPYAEFAGIPIALFGAGAYLVMLLLLLLENKSEFIADNGPMGVLLISLAGVLYSIYLTYVEIAILHAICPYCVVSAVVITVILIVAVMRYLRGRPIDD